MHLEPARLLLLLHIHRSGSLSGAAHALGRTPPAVSQQLARLEEEVGAQLVVRLPQGIRLTPLGRRLADHAERIAENLRLAGEDVRHHLGDHRDRLRLGAFPTAGLGLLPEALTALRHLRPGAELSVVDLGPTEGMELVGRQELDLAVVGEYAEPLTAPPGVELVHLLDDPIHAVLPVDHERASSETVRVSDFADEPWACASRELPNRRQLDEAAALAGITPTVPFASESYAVAQAIVSAGVAVSFVPVLALTHAARTVHRPLARPGLFRRIHAAVPSDSRHAPLTPLFLRLLHDVCAERETEHQNTEE